MFLNLLGCAKLSFSVVCVICCFCLALPGGGGGTYAAPVRVRRQVCACVRAYMGVRGAC